MGFGWASSGDERIILTAVLSCLNSAFYVCSQGVVPARRALRCAQGSGPTQPPPGPDPLRVGGFVGRCTRRTRGDAFPAANGVRIPGERIRRADRVRLYHGRLAQIRLRHERERTEAPLPACGCGSFPWASYGSHRAMVAILVAMALSPGSAKDLYFSLVTLVIAFIAYMVVRARRARRGAAAAAV